MLKIDLDRFSIGKIAPCIYSYTFKHITLYKHAMKQLPLLVWSPANHNK